MKRSAPNTWRYGGIINHANYNGGEASVVRWPGVPENIESGDVLVLLFTGAGMQVAAVEHPQHKAVAA